MPGFGAAAISGGGGGPLLLSHGTHEGRSSVGSGQSEGRAPDVMLEQPGQREDTGQVGGGKGPFPILRTVCAKRRLVRISQKNDKSIILHLERRT